MAALLLCEGRELAAAGPAVLAAVRALSTGGAVFAFPLYPGFFFFFQQVNGVSQRVSFCIS